MKNSFLGRMKLIAMTDGACAEILEGLSYLPEKAVYGPKTPTRIPRAPPSVFLDFSVAVRTISQYCCDTWYCL